MSWTPPSESVKQKKGNEACRRGADPEDSVRYMSHSDTVTGHTTILILRHARPGLRQASCCRRGDSSVISSLSQWRNQRRRHFNGLSGAERSRAQRPVARIRPPVHVPAAGSGSASGLFSFFIFLLKIAGWFELQWQLAVWMPRGETQLHGRLDSAS